MNRVEKIIPRDCEILLMGDTHEDIMMHEKGLLKHLDYVLKKPDSRFIIHVGDWIEAITTDDKRYMYHDGAVPIPVKQADKIIEIFKPVANNLIVGLIGNHERKHHRVMNFGEYITRALGCAYGTGMCRVIFKDSSGSLLFKFLVCHGQWTFTSHAKDYEQQQANMKAQLRMRLGNLKLADCVLAACGHAHKILISPPSNPLYLNDKGAGISQHYLDTDCTASYIPPEQRWYVCTGSYRKNMIDGIDDYAEGLGPVELGCVRVNVRDGKISSVDPMKL